MKAIIYVNNTNTFSDEERRIIGLRGHDKQFPYNFHMDDLDFIPNVGDTMDVCIKGIVMTLYIKRRKFITQETSFGKYTVRSVELHCERIV